MRVLVRYGLPRATIKWKCFPFQSSVTVRLQPLSGFIGVHASPPVADDNALRLYHRQLNDRNYEVRLLELYEASSPESGYKFQCRLLHGSLKEPLPYVALSYCWGDLQNKRDLVVEDVTIQVSDNLLSALEQLWRLGKTRIWVDYLSINQGDNDEKSGQVRMMDTIFAKAQTVFAWLGTESHDSDLAMAVLGASRLSQQVELPEEVEVACDAVIRLFSRPYWTRCWVIQEICRARSPIIICGRRYVPWGTMLKRLDRLGTSVPAQYARYLIAPLRHMRYRDQNRFRADTETGLIPLLVSSRRSLASDPRDKLYALLSLAKDGRVLVPTPNYSQTVEQVFFDTARCMIEEHDRTDVILLAHRTRGARDLPSWMPDWANLYCQPPPWIIDCLSQGRPRLMIHNRVYKDTLRVQGSHHDTVVEVLDMSEFADRQRGDQPLIEYTKSESVVNDLCMGLRIGDEADHKQITVVQLLKRMCNRNEAKASQPSRLESWVTHNASRRVGYNTLEEHLDRYTQDHARQYPSVALNEGNLEDTYTLEQAQWAIEEGFEMLERLRMTFVVTESGFLRVVYRDAKPGDHLYVLQNCPLPVVLRQTSKPGRFRFMGEVFVPKHFQEKASAVAGSMATVYIE
ncbi:HET-domain-containing protein [Xylariaceae sp. AK1471]|nr:HET-domain-containing protein [Xylariaceae sp. AK1471]